jgi:hypothetical protein
MNNVKIPGVLWVAGVVIAVALAHRYLEDPFLVELIIVVGTMILKGLNLGTKDLEQALEIIDLFKRQPKIVVPSTDTTPGLEPQMRGPMLKTASGAPIQVIEETTLIQEPPVLPAEPPRPNRIATWLLG